eukprot:TRINITY_DN4037_c0_g1::TRINITY_DN4037_c0_g1_i1::g.12016::m.12016 TRINITY_DN4037_c0_g1::TRINITY_DN4037_c0_g1_i1::g.12016  ORF type:complete len:631 (-),score=77.63,sp/Q9XGM8/MGAT1_ARATH/37.50/6e-47,GNT-I/PF03071.10/1.6e-72,Glyco_tranf_2_3/PF13641.1/4.7e-07,Glyco_transf_18/PF15024.1/6.2e-06,Glycos_transf_2/PF00535.21/0.0022,ABC2_membrane_3/PF12698.2/0.39 TRINITY_DN4037_c0_g1_i1:43-1935(-)
MKKRSASGPSISSNQCCIFLFFIIPLGFWAILISTLYNDPIRHPTIKVENLRPAEPVRSDQKIQSAPLLQRPDDHPIPKINSIIRDISNPPPAPAAVEVLPKQQSNSLNLHEPPAPQPIQKFSSSNEQQQQQPRDDINSLIQNQNQNQNQNNLPQPVSNNNLNSNNNYNNNGPAVQQQQQPNFNHPGPNYNPTDPPKYSVLMFTYNRPKYLTRSLDSLFSLGGLDQFPVFVSQDGHDGNVRSTLSTYHTKFTFTSWEHERPVSGPKQKGPEYISQHYHFALEKVFMEFDRSHVIIVEDDMIFAPDFFSYFLQTAPLLDIDPTLWCVSSWNDNGFSHLTLNQTLLFRNSYFPGLGWMLTKKLWLELRNKWPVSHWDHWMRTTTVNQGRECIAPEVSRNYNIGNEGVNMHASDYRKYLLNIRVSDAPYGTQFGDLMYLTKAQYADALQNQIMEATLAPASIFQWRSLDMLVTLDRRLYLVPYRREDFSKLGLLFKIWNVPRAYFQHVSIIKYKDKIFFLIDQRWSTLIPQDYALLRPQGLQFIAGEMGRSCHAVCATSGLRCSVSEFDFGNKCDILQQYFPCEGGCGEELGKDIPNYVSAVKNANYQRCLTTEENPTCEAAHPDTARLCPCI